MRQSGPTMISKWPESNDESKPPTCTFEDDDKRMAESNDESKPPTCTFEDDDKRMAREQ